MILLDTHVLLWLDKNRPRLGAKARKTIEAAFKAEDVAVSAISFWEVGTLIRKDRIRLEMDLYAWRKDFIKQGVNELPIDGEIGVRAAELESFHADPADRIIAATALQHSLTLITADRRLLQSNLAIKLVDASV